MKFIFASILACYCMLTQNLSATETVTDKATGVSFPKEIAFESAGSEYLLNATGVATRKKLFVKVYSVASYLQSPPNNKEAILEAIFSDDKAKQLTMIYVRDITDSQIKDGFKESFQKVFSKTELVARNENIHSFLNFFSKGIKSGDEIVLRWIPGGTVEAILNGNRLGEIANVDFARGLWKIWFTPNGVVDTDALISMH